MPQNAFFFSDEVAIFWSAKKKKKKRHKDTIFPTHHPLFPVISASETIVVEFVLLRNSSSVSVVIHSVKPRLLKNRPGSDALTSRDILRERFQRALTRADQLHWTAEYHHNYNYFVACILYRHDYNYYVACILYRHDYNYFVACILYRHDYNYL